MKNQNSALVSGSILSTSSGSFDGVGVKATTGSSSTTSSGLTRAFIVTTCSMTTKASTAETLLAQPQSRFSGTAREIRPVSQRRELIKDAHNLFASVLQLQQGCERTSPSSGPRKTCSSKLSAAPREHPQAALFSIFFQFFQPANGLNLPYHNRTCCESYD